MLTREQMREQIAIIINEWHSGMVWYAESVKLANAILALPGLKIESDDQSLPEPGSPFDSEHELMLKPNKDGNV